jgi:hypothetical protein
MAAPMLPPVNGGRSSVRGRWSRRGGRGRASEVRGRRLVDGLASLRGLRLSVLLVDGEDRRRSAGAG